MVNWRTGSSVLLLGALVIFFLVLGVMPSLLPRGTIRNLIFPILVLCALLLTAISTRFWSGRPTLLIWATVYTISYWMLVAKTSRAAINFLALLIDVDNTFSLVADVSLVHLLLTIFLILARRTDDASLYAFVISFGGCFLLLTISNLVFSYFGDYGMWTHLRIFFFCMSLLAITLLGSISALIAELAALLLREFRPIESAGKQKGRNS